MEKIKNLFFFFRINVYDVRKNEYWTKLAGLHAYVQLNSRPSLCA